MTLLDRQKEFTRYLVAGFPEYGLKGLPFVSACAITGNASQESLVKAVTGPVDHGSDGVLQWRLDRLDGPRGLRGWAKENGIPWDTLRTQAAFTLWELKRDYSDRPAARPLYQELMDGKRPIETLTANFCDIYERPNMALAHLDNRFSHAKSIYQIMKPEFSASIGAKVGGAIVATGAGAAGANVAMGGDEWTSAIVAGGSLLAGLVSWLAPKVKDTISKPRVETPAPKPPPPEEAHEVIHPLEIEHSDIAAYEAANMDCLALEQQLAEAYARRDAELKRVEERALKMLASVNSQLTPVVKQTLQPLPVNNELGE